MAKIATLNKKLTTSHRLSISLMLLYLISPLDILFLQTWSFTIGFIHESGHAYFDLFFGDKYTIIYTNPFQTHTVETDSLLENILVRLGGIIFTTIFFLGCILLIFLIFKYKGWQYRTSIHLGTDTIGFHVNVFLFISFFTEFISNSFPYISNNRLSDGGKILGTYLNLPWVVIANPELVPVMNVFLALIFLPSYMLLVSNSFYCLMKKLVKLRMKYFQPPQPSQPV